MRKGKASPLHWQQWSCLKALTGQRFCRVLQSSHQHGQEKRQIGREEKHLDSGQSTSFSYFCGSRELPSFIAAASRSARASHAESLRGNSGGLIFFLWCFFLWHFICFSAVVSPIIGSIQCISQAEHLENEKCLDGSSFPTRGQHEDYTGDFHSQQLNASLL